MADLILAGNQPGANLSTLHLLDWVNEARASHGEPVLRRNVFHARVADELDGDYYKKIVVQNSNRTTTEAYELTQEQCMLVAMRESKSVRRVVLEKLKGLSPSVPQSLPEALRLAADMAEKNAQLSVANEQLAGEVEALHNLFDEGMTPAAFAKRLNGVNCQQISHELHRRNWLYHDGFGWRVTSYARDRYLTERHSNVPRSSGQVMLRATPVLLRKGAVALHKIYLDGQLPMKRTWDGLFTHNKAIEKVA
ncbi:hypothetical protein [Marinobacter sp. CA1]|uniref:hypothetical protein n=1 Tax=Marinobacter sp. CA1 TaxID=2817656 RepID=UPI001D05F59A|nr:hypothetical protein [Marinobacter sp. CA1]UDL03999.1 hypothetical protein J2887_14920 [Marinobacter sp. CA1]